MKKLILVLLMAFFVLALPQAKADHLVGGEITWQCLSTGPDIGKFIFRLVLYRDCGGAPSPTFGVIQTSNGCPVSTIDVSAISVTDISPVCDTSGCPAFSAFTCATATATTLGAIQKVIMESAPVTIAGVPPANGWLFKYESCCSQNYMTNVDPYLPLALRAFMFPYNSQNTYPCFDSSPQFTEDPSYVMNTGYNNYSHNASDVEFDALTYSWAQRTQSYSGITPVVSSWNAGYSTTSQLPSATQNPANIAAVLDSATGEISFTSFTIGRFATGIKIQAHKYGQLVAEIYRDVQVILFAAPLPYPGGFPNNAPSVNKPFYNGTSCDTTVYAGDSVCFNILAEDYDEKCAMVFQGITIEASGVQFGTGFSSSTSGCLVPPCATLNPPPGDSLVTNVLAGASSQFCWKTECQHVDDDTSTYSYDSTLHVFTINVFDNFCPVPGLNQMAVKITVKDRPSIPASSMRCTEVLPNGDVKVSWVPVTESPGLFNGYEVWRFDSVNNFYSHLTTLSDSVNTSSYIDTTANADTIPLLYFVKTVSGCYQLGVSNMIATMSLFAYSNDGSSATLAWNAISDPLLPSNTGLYKIYRFYAGTWTLIDSVYNVTDSLLHYVDLGTDLLPLDSLKYRVEVDDASGCTSVSRVTNVYIDVNNTGLDEVNSFTVKLFPNPATNVLNLEIKNLKSEQIELSIKNQLGQMMKQETLNAKGGSINKQIELDKFAPGIYFINVKSEGYNQNLKLIKL